MFLIFFRLENYAKKYLGFPKHGIINLDHLTQSLHEALEMNTYDDPGVLAGIRSMNLELHLTELVVFYHFT